MWGISPEEKSSEELALAGVEALAGFIREMGLPSSLREIGIEDKSSLREIAYSCGISQGSYKKMTHEEILNIFEECF